MAACKTCGCKTKRRLVFVCCPDGVLCMPSAQHNLDCLPMLAAAPVEHSHRRAVPPHPNSGRPVSITLQLPDNNTLPAPHGAAPTSAPPRPSAFRAPDQLTDPTSSGLHALAAIASKSMSLPVDGQSMPWGVLRPKPQRVSAAMQPAGERPLYWAQACSAAAADQPQGGSPAHAGRLVQQWHPVRLAHGAGKCTSQGSCLILEFVCPQQ